MLTCIYLMSGYDILRITEKATRYTDGSGSPSLRILRSKIVYCVYYISILQLRKLTLRKASLPNRQIMQAAINRTCSSLQVK